MAFDSSEISDDALMVLYANGDIDAAEILTTRHTAKIMGLAFRMLGNRAAAEDIAQDTMIRMWKAAPTWRQGEAKLSTWLYRVASNLCTDELRKRRGSSLDDIDDPSDDKPSAEQRLLAQERSDALRNGLLALPDRQRLAVTLRHIEELSNPEIAEIMGITIEAVESLTARGKRNLAQKISADKTKLGLV